MLSILENLEPRFEEKGSYLFDGHEVREVIFIQQGKVDVGYMYNDKEKYVLRYQDATVLGAYNCTYNRDTEYIYRCPAKSSGFFIPKVNWNEIM